MRRIIVSLVMLLIAGTVAVAGVSTAVLTDEGEVLGNTVVAGSLDVKVNGEDETLTNEFSADNIKPDNGYVNLGTMTVSNEGTLNGAFRLSLSNFYSDENGLMAPEETAGDSDATQVDNTGYAEVDGDGELGSQIGMRIFVDENEDGVKQWNEETLWFGEHIDYSSYYSLAEGEDIAADNAITLAAGERMEVGFEVRWIDDTTNSWWGAYSGMSNNQGMSDTFVFDVTVGLDQL